MNLHIPTEAVPRKRRNRLLDWRFLVSLTALILVCLLVWASVRNYDIREAEAAQKDALIAQSARQAAQVGDLQSEVIKLQDRMERVREQARDDRKEARRERRQLIRQQAVMIRLLKRWRVVPRSYTPARVTSRGPSRTANSTPRGGEVHSPPVRRSTKRASVPRPKPQPTAGKSGKTPKGKAKGLRR